MGQVEILFSGAYNVKQGTHERPMEKRESFSLASYAKVLDRA